MTYEIVVYDERHSIVDVRPDQVRRVTEEGISFWGAVSEARCNGKIEKHERVDYDRFSLRSEEQS